MDKNKNPSFLRWTLKSKTKRAGLAFLLLFSLLGRLFMYSDLLSIPCDGQFLCGFWRHLDELPFFLILSYELATTVPFALVLLSFWGLYKSNVLFKKPKP